MFDFFHLVDGCCRDSQDYFEVINPATEEVVALCPECDEDLLDEALQAAQIAQVAWGNMTFEERTARLGECAELLASKSSLLAPLLTNEHGKPLKKARWEIEFAAEWIREICSLRLPDTVKHENEFCYLEETFEPIGVVAAIVPWNFPIKLAIRKIAPNLLVGNTLVIKPSPHTPLTVMKAASFLGKILPKGVLNVVAGGGRLGRLLCQHSRVNLISFTGSVETGREIAAAAGAQLKPVVLELGGNDAALVLGDCVPSKIAYDLVWSCLGNMGQGCTNIKRLFIHERIYPDMLREMIKVAESIAIGGGFEDGVEFGPLNNKALLTRMIEMVEDAVHNGGTVRCGGKRLERPGYFFPPTIITDVSSSSRVVSEEQFGPIIPVASFKDEAQALEIANSSDFGLGGSVWTNDNIIKARELTRQLECGTTWINWHGPVMSNSSFGGWKKSGLGMENGERGLQQLCRIKVLSSRKSCTGVSQDSCPLKGKR